MKYFKILIIIILAGGAYGYYLYSKPMADAGSVTADYKMSADSLFKYFDENETEANKKYLGKVIEVQGKIRDLSVGKKGEKNIMLASSSDFFGINCELSKTQNEQFGKYKIGGSIKIKGECTGVLSDVVLTRCVIVSDN